ncbi:MAG: EF-hand domain-containing protein [Myxococcales bacterium]|nr:MAG: EF-hand domain-containing protein [Myxococcales bacterium]
MSVSGVNSVSGLLSLQAMRKRPSETEMFDRADKNGDGGIDKVELSEAASKISERSGETIDVEQLLTDYDQDENGVLNQDEMKKAMDSLRQKMGPPPGPPPMEGADAGRMATQSLLEALNASSQDSESATSTYSLLANYFTSQSARNSIDLSA